MKLFESYISKQFKTTLEHLDFPKSGLNRNALVNLLHMQNKNVSEKVSDNIDSLKDENTFAVVTGQQMGLLGGPLYTLYKTLNTIKVCEELKSRYDDKHFVPIFWMEGEDADFEEVSYLNYLKDDKILKYQYYEDSKLAIARREFNLEINDLTHIVGYEQPFESERNWSEAFYLFFKPILDEYGIIAFQPNDKEVYNTCIDFWEIVKSNHYLISKSIKTESDHLLSEGYNLQVPLSLDETFLFKHSKNDRIKIKANDSFDPYIDWLSPNVLLRPLYQDFIFPTVAYIAGNAEISYQMQVSKAYDIFDREPPLLFPRTHHILINPKMDRLIQKYKIKELFDYKKFKHEMELILKTELNDHIDQHVDQFRTQASMFIKQLDELEFTEANTRKTLLEGFNVRHNKILNQIQNKMNNLVKRKDHEKIRHLAYIENLIFPKNNLQERFYPSTQFDPNLKTISKCILEQLNIFDFNFQIIKIK